jgi:hypothetical protein
LSAIHGRLEGVLNIPGAQGVLRGWDCTINNPAPIAKEILSIHLCSAISVSHPRRRAASNQCMKGVELIPSAPLHSCPRIPFAEPLVEGRNPLKNHGNQRNCRSASAR